MFLCSLLDHICSDIFITNPTNFTTYPRVFLFVNILDESKIIIMINHRQRITAKSYILGLEKYISS